MDRQAFYALIDKWNRGEATDEEVQALMNYYHSFRDTPEWDEARLGDRSAVEAEMEQRLLRSIRQLPQQQAPVRRMRWLRVAAAAAVLLLLAGAAWWYRAGRGPAELRQQTLVTQAGQHRQLELADGTKVWLSPASTLQYPQRFTGPAREVSLSGEAFFEVAPGAEHPFIIHSGAVDTRVLGTSFTIQAYAAQPDIGVTVVTGKVAVSTAQAGSQPAVTLSPQQQVVFSKATGRLRKTDKVDTRPLLLRRAGILKYNRAPLQEVVAELGCYYNVSIIIEGPTDNCFYFGEFNTNRELEKALRQLCLTLNATLVKKDGAYIIRKGRC
ncbi:FecR family protein [Chitinophaga japonensis]|uniref:FecR family protein n=1 Tax=Chitinophaga japonensis TaxID=104662 RepID=A0A562TBP5_CHIJA|nr:FecR family protein [Chitinophaga japonensis]TWI90991.1 FecR family protein [Chitinophaga japonensis]